MGGGMGGAGGGFGGGGAPGGTAGGAGAGRGGRGGGAATAASPATPPATQMQLAGSGMLARADSSSGISMETLRGIQSMANAQEVGSLFKYDIKMPVSLSRQESAMLPIVNESVEGTKVSIYNQRVQAKYPLCGLQFKNTTKFHLMQGPVTVFDDSVYAGDARIEDLPPGGKRLLSYALDLDTEVAPLSKSPRERPIVSVKIVKGTATISRKMTRETTYTVKNSGKKAKTVLIETPLEGNWKLVTPKEATEKTRDLYRFEVKTQPGESKEFVVQEEQPISETISLSNASNPTIQILLSETTVDGKVKDAIKEVVKRQDELVQLRNDKVETERRVKVIMDDLEKRIRPNMTALRNATTDEYNAYVKEMRDKDAELKPLQEKLNALSDKEIGLRKSLDDYLAGLNIE
jgi:hypothetical protein